MAATANSRRAGIGGIALLLSGFTLFCAILMLVAGAWRSYRTHIIESRWSETSARVEKCGLDVYHPFSRNGGGTVYALRCRVDYEFGLRRYESDFHTTSDRSQQVRDQIDVWAARHGRDAVLNIRVNPSNPREIAVESQLPIHQFNTARESWLTAMAFSAGGLLLLATRYALRL